MDTGERGKEKGKENEREKGHRNPTPGKTNDKGKEKEKEKEKGTPDADHSAAPSEDPVDLKNELTWFLQTWKKELQGEPAPYSVRLASKNFC